MFYLFSLLIQKLTFSNFEINLHTGNKSCMDLVSNCLHTLLVLIGWYFNNLGHFHLFHGRYYFVVSLPEVPTRFINWFGAIRWAGKCCLLFIAYGKVWNTDVIFHHILGKIHCWYEWILCFPFGSLLTPKSLIW